ncbi:response regulator [Caenimonas aquaedulcis]|uniref:Response regulator transcription factor n=1 Tax=Caenimonas aquaedulcis TaxID=2793270 RepID=A0A931H508_9BURK|nr:response regulator transcription factor [Caenimonas aquaedulcis]MBG9388761.1 response regulator transcription factor [Caenimonas aquaedulcis]
MIRVVVAEDHELVRLGVRMLLTRTRRYQVVAETAAGKDLESLVRAHDAQLVLLDLSLSDCAGLGLTSLLRRTFPQLKIVVVTGEASPLLAQDGTAAGADGFVLKDGKGEELVLALDAVMKGGRYLSPQLGSMSSG